LAPTIVVVILVIAALAALLWSGFRNLPDPIEPAPVITGGVDQDAGNGDQLDPGIVPADQSHPELPPTTDPGDTVPTIAPVREAVVVVPNLQGLTIGGAMGTLLPLDLRMTPDQPVYSDSVPLNAVVSQDPPPGTRVAPGATVRVSLSRGSSRFPVTGQP